jgi:phosphohistidine phosphatase
MKRLTLVRHAKSDWSLPGQDDWDRPLNKRGLRDAPEMARRLRERKLRPDLMLSSPAVRALTTATIMARELKFDPARVAQDERLYLASAQVLLDVVRELGGDAGHLMVFGHNPGLTDFAARLAPGEAPDNVVTCGVFTAEYALENWSDLDWGSAHNVDFDYPKNA